MNSPRDPEQAKETVFVYNMSPQLEAELLRRSREKGTDPGAEAAEILEEHAEEADEME